MINAKIFIGNDIVLSKAVQEKLFNLGCYWCDGGTYVFEFAARDYYLFIRDNKIMWDNRLGGFTSSPLIEIKAYEFMCESYKLPPNMASCLKPELQAERESTLKKSRQKEYIPDKLDLTAYEDFMRGLR